MSERGTLKAMVVIGVMFWLFAIAYPGVQLWIVLFAAVLIGWSVYHLLAS